MGNGAGYTSTGSSNVFLGASSGYRGTTGSNNTYVGKEAGLGNVFSTPTGSNNTAIGEESLKAISGAAAQNTAIGKDAGVAVTTGSNNTFLGYDAGDATTTSTNNTIIGNGADASSATVSNEITLGNTAVTKFRIPGINFTVKDSTATENYVLTVDASGEAGWEAAAGGSPAVSDISDLTATATELNYTDGGYK